MNTTLRNLRQAAAAKWLPALLMLLCLAQEGHAQLLQWNTYGNAGTETAEPSVYNNSNIAAATLTLGSGITPAGNGNRFGGSGWWKSGNISPNTLTEAIANNSYIEFTVTPNAGVFFTPTSLSFIWDRSATAGPTAVTLRSSADNYAADLGSVTGIASSSNPAPPPSFVTNTIPITGLTNLSGTTFRLYGYGASAAGTGGFDQPVPTPPSSGVVNVQLNGTTCTAPTAYYVYGGGTFCSGGAGVNVNLTGSDYGVNYQLKNNGTAIGTAVAGNGSGLSFGLQNSVGTYTVTATRTTGGCAAAMNGSATVAYSTADINIQGYGADIPDGSITTSAASLTNFNSVRVGGSATRTYTIQNLGNSTLSISGGSASNSEFVVTVPGTTISPSGSTTFTVKFTPSATGQRTAVIHIQNSDCDEGDYDFAVEGTGRTSAALYVDASATGSNDGFSWANAFTDFQSALSTASAGDTVFVAQGTYKPSIGILPSPTARTNMFTLTDGAVYFGGFPAGGGSIASRNFSTYRTILSGDIGAAYVNTDNCFLVVNAINLTVNTVLNGFTIEGGRADSAGYTIYSRASAISLGSTGAMQLESVTVRNNTANSAVSGDGPVAWSVQHCSFENNSGYGAVYIGGVASGAFTDCAFTNNTGLNGGAISQNVNSATFSFTSCSFTGNVGNYGGGGGAINAGNAANTFTNCSFTNNSSVGGGGALNKFYATTNAFSYCTFSGNSGYGGGALYGQGGFNIDHCVFSQNYATGSPSTYSSHGGAIYNNGTPSTISNTVFRSNQTLYGAGGAIYNNTGGTMNLTNCTFTGNNAGGFTSGGALNNNSSSNANISNCIFWGNTANGGHTSATAEIVYYTGMLNVNNTIWQGNTSGGTIYNADPLFTNAATGDLTLQDCSPAIDSGASNSLTTDILGNPRPVDVFPGGLSNDIGAYERQAAPLPREINVRGNNIDIPDGTATATSANYTHFGSGITSRTFTIQNTASGGPLSISGVTITGANASDFSVAAAPASPVAANSSTTLTISFNGNPGGLRKAVVHIANSDCDEGDYDFAISGISIRRFYVDLSATGTNDGASWANAFTDFQSALNLAASGDTVLVAKGIYKPSVSIQPSPTPRTRMFTLANGVAYYGGFPQGGGAFASRNFAGNRTILSGDIGTLNDSTDNCFVVVNAQNISNSTLMSGFTIERGNGDSVSNAFPYVIYQQAGGMNIGASGAIRLDSVTIRNCFGRRGAGGLEGIGSHSITMRGCNFSNNNPRGVSFQYAGAPVLINDTFANNAPGGAMFLYGNGSFTGCRFTGNYSANYGGAVNDGAGGSNFTDCSFSNNSAALEGGVLFSFYGVHTFTRCAFNQNSAGNDGGCIAIDAFTGGVTLDRCVFTNNSSTTGKGGALYMQNRTSDISNCVFWNNTAPGSQGGALFNNGGVMNVTNSSFNKNACGSATGGAMMTNAGTGTVSNCIFWGNIAGGVDASTQSELWGGNVAVNNTIWQDYTATGSNNIFSADPRFANAATGDLTLQDCSPAIDTGVANSLTTDVAGNPRPVDAFIGGRSYDLGAYERQTTPQVAEINIHDGASPTTHQVADASAAATASNYTDFGGQTLGLATSYTYTIQNTGTIALSITGSSIDNTTTGYGDFAITGLPGNIGVGSTGTFTVTFTPTTLGVRSAKIHIANNDCDEGDYDFVVAGTGSCTLLTAGIAINSPAKSTICSGSGTTLSFSGAPNATVTYTDGSSNSTVSLNGSGSATAGVSPMVNTTYSLVSTATGACGNAVSGSVSVTVNAAPTFTAVTGNQTANTSPASCDAAVTYTTLPAVTPCAALTYAFSGATTASGSGTGSGLTFNKGITNVVITAANGCAPDAVNSFTVTVSDKTPPVITAPLPKTVSGYCSPINASASAVVLGTPTVSDNCPGVTYVNDAPASYPIGNTIVTWTATDAAGNQKTATQTVTITGPVPAFSAAALASPLYPMTGQKIQTIFLNYPASAQTDSVKITPTGGTAPYSYSWTMGGCNNPNAVAPLSTALAYYVFAPSSLPNSGICNGNGDNLYTFNITITDDHGCKASAMKRLNVVNPYTSSARDSVLVCHKIAARGPVIYQLNKTPASQAATYTNAGDQLGNCNIFTGRMGSGHEEEQTTVLTASGREVQVYPNPSTGLFTVQLSDIEEAADIVVTDVQGRIVARRIITKDAPVAKTSFELNDVAKGIYLIQVKDGTLNYRTKIVVQ